MAVLSAFPLPLNLTHQKVSLQDPALLSILLNDLSVYWGNMIVNRHVPALPSGIVVQWEIWKLLYYVLINTMTALQHRGASCNTLWDSEKGWEAKNEQKLAKQGDCPRQWEQHIQKPKQLQYAVTLCCEVLVLIPDEVKQRGMISGGPGNKESTNRKTPVREISILNGQVTIWGNDT